MGKPRAKPGRAMTSIRNRRQTRSILQNRRVQLIHALLIVTYLSVYTLLLSAATLAPTVMALRGDAEHATLNDAAELFLFENRVWPLAVGLILACGVHSIFMSHRVFGPLVRVRREVELIGQGDLSRRLRFRRNDHMLELRDALNDMVRDLDRQMSEVHLARARCRHRLEELEDGIFARGGADRRRLLEDLVHDFGELERGLNTFKTSGGWERLKPAELDTTPATIDQAEPATTGMDAEGKDEWQANDNEQAASA